MKEVELVQAWTFACEECGRDNFVRCISAKLSPDDEEDARVMRELMHLDVHEEIPEGAGGEFATQPNVVVCEFCRTKFNVAREEGPDEDLEGER